MKLMIFVAAALALTGCTGVPITRTAFNDDACLRRSSSPSVEKLPVTPRQPGPTNCKSMGASWSGVGAPENRRFDPS